MMNDHQFQVLVTRLNLLIDLMILDMKPRPTVQLRETSYRIEGEGQQKTVVTQTDGDILLTQHAVVPHA